MCPDPQNFPAAGAKISPKTPIFERFRANFVAKQGGFNTKGGFNTHNRTDSFLRVPGTGVTGTGVTGSDRRGL